ncbi:MAG: molybdenum cofactor guanylyltransferase [Syntrophomonadaceae bacterium]|nr:molybdenum cofactor guanylyltransferase [Syntrophomonadaceae bacterium]
MLQAAAIILAGGKNSRMEKNKALLKMGEKTVIERIIDELEPLVERIIVVTNSPEEYSWLGVEVIRDIVPGRGPLSGIHAGLKHSPYRYNLVVACDMPFVSRKLGQLLLRRTEGCQAVVPRINQKPQPLFAVYSRDCIQPIEQMLQKGRLKCTSFYDLVSVVYLDESEIGTTASLEVAFTNINTPEEFERALAIAKVNEARGNGKH